MARFDKKAVRAILKQARGSLKGKMGDEPFAVRMARFTQEEKELEERKFRQFFKSHDQPPGR